MPRPRPLAMHSFRTPFQRLALAALIVCAGFVIGSRMLHAGHTLVQHFGHHDREVDLDLDMDLDKEIARAMAEVDVEIARAMEEADVEMEAISVELGAVTASATASASGTSEVLFEQTFAVQPGDRLSVALSSEDLVVETGAREASVTVLGEGRDARADFARRRFSAAYSGGTLRVETNPERSSWQNGRRASYTVVVRVPERLGAEVNLASGDARIGNLQGDLSLATASGDVVLSRVEGAATITINAASGDVQADLLDGGEVRVQTASGDLRVARLAAQTATVQTASGDLEVEVAGADRFEAHTASGNLALDWLDALSVSLNTASGDVAFGLESPAEVEVSTGSGDVSLGLPRGGFEVALEGPSIDIDGDLGFQGRRGRRSAEGRLGAGGPRVHVSTGSGEIALMGR